MDWGDREPAQRRPPPPRPVAFKPSPERALPSIFPAGTRDAAKEVPTGFEGREHMRFGFPDDAPPLPHVPESLHLPPVPDERSKTSKSQPTIRPSLRSPVTEHPGSGSFLRPSHPSPPSYVVRGGPSPTGLRHGGEYSNYEYLLQGISPQGVRASQQKARCNAALSYVARRGKASSPRSPRGGSSPRGVPASVCAQGGSGSGRIDAGTFFIKPQEVVPDWL